MYLDWLCRLSKSTTNRDSSRSRDCPKATKKKSLASLMGREPYHTPSVSDNLPDHEDLMATKEAKDTKVEQSQSAFISRLPYEVRSMIYEEVLCRPIGVVHITTRRDGRLVYFRCRAEDARCRGLECFHDPNQDLYGTWRTRDKDLFSTWNTSITPNLADRGLLALLQSCQQIYGEAINVLYTRNTFSFMELSVFLHFTSMIAPENLASVQSLQFEDKFFRELCYRWPHLHPWAQGREWIDTHRILSSIQGLRKVRVKVDMPANGFDESEYASELMKHLMEGSDAKVLVEAM